MASARTGGTCMAELSFFVEKDWQMFRIVPQAGCSPWRFSTCPAISVYGRLCTVRKMYARR